MSLHFNLLMTLQVLKENKDCFKKEKAPANYCKGKRYPQQESNLQPTD